MVKCVVWDLDDTLWDGTLLEKDAIKLRHEVVDTIRALNSVGILNSVASRGEESIGRAALRNLGVEELFVIPQIGWGAKSAAVGQVARALRISLETIVYVDDDAVERAEVSFKHQNVRVCSSRDAIILRGEWTGNRPPTVEAQHRRRYYVDEERRREAEQEWQGPPGEFLRSLCLEITVQAAGEGDVARAVELFERTSQLNSRGKAMAPGDVAAIATNASARLVKVQARDRFGDCGTVGFIAMRRVREGWLMESIAVSCRVLTRGVATAAVAAICRECDRAGTGVSVRFRPTAANRPMYVALKMAGFVERDVAHGVCELWHVNKEWVASAVAVNVDVSRSLW